MNHQNSVRPTRQLPSSPSIEQLKKQAKDLLKALKKKEPSACAVLRRHSRFRDTGDEEILESKVSLQEVQHALALEYGFENWPLLRQHIRRMEQPAAESAVSTNTGSERDILMRLLAENVRERSSDIHFDPTEGHVRVRFRIDGVLYEKESFPEQIGQAVIREAMRIAAMDPTRDLPQDGRAILDVGGQSLALFVNAMDGVQGVILTIRCIDHTRGPMRLEELGFEVDQLERYRKMISQPTGLILATGPTGCGKTTLLYATLEELNLENRKIMSAEDPVEFVLNGVSQVQIHPDKGLDFPRILRNFLRQDPDVIMAAEIRNRETAEVLVQAALTGHMVFSTLHADDSPRALIRLLDIGVEPFLLRDTVRGVVAPRLLRRVCPACLEEYRPSVQEWELLGVPEERRGIPLARGRGCDQCRKTGYRGRTCAMSLLEIGPHLREAIGHVDFEGLKAAAREDGWHTLREVAIEKVLRGETTAKEAVRVT